MKPSTLFQLKSNQLDSTMQANKVMEARISSTSSSQTGSTSREQELEQQLSLHKTLVEAQRLESYNLYSEIQQAKAEILALKEAALTLPIPTQQSQPFSRGASTSTSMPRTTELPPSTSGATPTPMETDQGYNPLQDNPIQDDPLPPTRHLLTQRPGDDRMVEDHRRQLNERQAIFERRCKAVLRQLWPEMEDSSEKMCHPST